MAFGVALLPQAVPGLSMTSVVALGLLVLGVRPPLVVGEFHGLPLCVGVALGVGDPVLLGVGEGVADALAVGPGVLLALGVGLQVGVLVAVGALVAVLFCDFGDACWPGCAAAGGGCHSVGVARPATAGGC